jgi:hypothetical protein
LGCAWLEFAGIIVCKSKEGYNELTKEKLLNIMKKEYSL